jgi:beta-glucosidase
VPEAAVDELARRVLRLAARVGLLAGAPAAVTELPAEIDGEALAREVAARSFTLLANDGILPLDPAPASVALIGAAAAQARIGGGGSAEVFPTRVVSPLDGLRAAFPAGTELSYAQGADPRTHVPPLATPLSVDLCGRDGSLLGVARVPDGSVRWIGEMPSGVVFGELGEVHATATLTPQVGGLHRLAVRGSGRYVLEAAGETLFDGVIEVQGDDPAAAFLNPPESVFELELEAGRPVELSIRHILPRVSGFAGFGLVSFVLGHSEPVVTADELIEQAVALAAATEVAVVVVATTEEVESEGVDRAGLALPGRQDELVARVAAANPRTVVVVNAGAPVLTPWREDVAAVLLTWFPGQEAGAALADVLLGLAEPGGRLPTTWPAEQADCPVWEVETTEGALAYTEGLFIGYPAWQRRAGARPAYWFGHGLGYTDWAYEGLDVRLSSPVDGEDPYAARAEAVVRVRNTGSRAGRETVQLYLAPDGADRTRPDRRLAGFTVVTAEPGAVVEARVPLPLRAFQTWGDAGWAVRPGTYAVEAGRSAADRRLVVALDVPVED